jgi:hypothetical protein
VHYLEGGDQVGACSRLHGRVELLEANARRQAELRRERCITPRLGVEAEVNSLWSCRRAPGILGGGSWEVHMSRRQIGLLGVTEEVAGDLVAWLLLLLGVVFGLGVLAAVELLMRLGSL